MTEIICKMSWKLLQKEHGLPMKMDRMLGVAFEIMDSIVVDEFLQFILMEGGLRNIIWKAVNYLSRRIHFQVILNYVIYYNYVFS